MPGNKVVEFMDLVVAEYRLNSRDRSLILSYIGIYLLVALRGIYLV